MYTHGNGFVAAPANRYLRSRAAAVPATRSSPSPTSEPGGELNQADPGDQPRIYYGQLGRPDYSIVGGETAGKPREYDTDHAANYTYSGSGGVPVGNLFNRLVFATQYAERNFLFSSELNGDSKIIYNRDPRDRVEKVAPLLTVDTKPYPAVVDGKILWIVDGYTTRDELPVRAADVRSQMRPPNSQVDAGQPAGAGQRPGVLHPQLGEGHRRRVRRQGQALPGRRRGSGAEGLEGGVPRRCRAEATRSPRICWRTSGTRRTCSRCSAAAGEVPRQRPARVLPATPSSGRCRAIRPRGSGGSARSRRTTCRCAARSGAVEFQLTSALTRTNGTTWWLHRRVVGSRVVRRTHRAQIPDERDHTRPGPDPTDIPKCTRPCRVRSLCSARRT